jgi:hypothetical protein
MSDTVSDVDPAVLNPAAAPHLAPGERRTILFYAGLLIVALNLVTPASGFQLIPVSFILKNKLHLSAHDLATFALWAGIPGYLSFVFGIVRDSWDPFGRGDRGYLMLFGGLTAALFALFAFFPVSEPMLLTATLLTTITFLFTWSAWNGLGSVIGQQFAMSGQISALWNFAGTATIFAALSFGGLLSDRLEGESAGDAIRIIFLMVAAVFAGITLIGVWRPDAVYRHLVRDTSVKTDFAADMKRLFRHWPIYPALGAFLLWNFSPGGSTVLQYYMSDTLRGSDTQWGAYTAFFAAAALPAYALFGFLSPRYSLRTLLFWGAIIAIPQMVPVLFVHSASALVWAAIPMGMIGGIATAAYMDLLIRSCPKGLEGTLMMLAWSMYSLSVNIGNLLGTHLYDWSGIFPCIAVTTIVYALIVPILMFVPKALVAMPDGDAP